MSAKNLLRPCLTLLLQVLHSSDPDQATWLRSYLEEKGGLEEHDVYERIKKAVHQPSLPEPDPQGLAFDVCPACED